MEGTALTDGTPGARVGLGPTVGVRVGVRRADVRGRGLGRPDVAADGGAVEDGMAAEPCPLRSQCQAGWVPAEATEIPATPRTASVTATMMGARKERRRCRRCERMVRTRNPSARL